MTRRYAHESHVELAETAAPHPTREELLAQQRLDDRRRARAAQARARIRGDHHAQP